MRQRRIADTDHTAVAPKSQHAYTISNSPTTGDPLGRVPPPSQFDPQNRKDAVLVNDPVVEKIETVIQADTVDSRNLHRTAVLATLDCPLPEQKNAIWCSTFQMAWDRLKDDVIGEAIQVPTAASLVGRLNQGAFPLGDIEPQSYYVFAGRVEDGALEQIQREMKSRFPSEPHLVFSKGYRTLPDAVAGYAYLNVDVAFSYPYYTYPRAFRFEDSNGASADVTAFSAQSSAPDAQPRQVREQVEIVYWKYGETAAGDEFAVDLSKHTKPYQVILARMSRPATLRDAAHALQGGMAEFPNDPNYETLRRLRTIDTLVVPDVLFKLTHHFEELLDEFLANEGWQKHFFFEAMQKIEFTLSRTGVVLRSEARLASARRGELGEPRRLHFNRPFLICVCKRRPDATPFFLMWVDNPELMRPYEAAGPGDQEGHMRVIHETVGPGMQSRQDADPAAQMLRIVGQLCIPPSAPCNAGIGNNSATAVQNPPLTPMSKREPYQHHDVRA